MSLAYIVPRVIRHFMPERLARFMLMRSMIIRPGLETVDPVGAVRRYLEVLQSRQMGIQGRRVLVFGYGGRFDIGVGLLEAGAAHVALCERFARPDDRHNLSLQRRYAKYICTVRGAPRPNPVHMRLIEADVRRLPSPESSEGFDLVVSNSVYEHVDDVAGVTKALAGWTRAGGIQIHFVDLRDHYFKYPFEMLTFSERNWQRFLNPTSNHNRLRMWDYRRIFEANFSEVNVDVFARDESAFARVRRRLRPEFVSGDVAEDSVTLIWVTAAKPIR